MGAAESGGVAPEPNVNAGVGAAGAAGAAGSAAAGGATGAAPKVKPRPGAVDDGAAGGAAAGKAGSPKGEAAGGVLPKRGAVVEAQSGAELITPELAAVASAERAPKVKEGMGVASVAASSDETGHASSAHATNASK